MSYVALDIFQHLRQEDVQWILASAELKTIPANGVLVREDDPSDAIFFVADGLFDVHVFAGQPIKVGQLGPGEVIGEISWLDRKPVSASVRAVETSAVLALSTALLEHKLAGDPVFAARLFRGLATLTAERLRKTTSQVRRSQWAATPQPTLAKSAGGSAILQKVGEFKALVAAADKEADAGGKLLDATAARVRRAFEGLERATGPQSAEAITGLSDALQAELLPFVRLTETGERLYAKPRGYAADFQTIETIYANTPKGEGRIGTALDGCILNLAALKAIRNRRHLIATEILSALSSTTKEVHIASLGCGPAREIFDVLERIDDAERLHVSCIDVDREALAQVEARCAEEKLGGSVRTFHGNLIYLATGRQELDLRPQDLIYSLGLIDYVSDEAAIELINWMHGNLRPGGRVILGSFHPRNPTRGLMDHVLDWRLVHRDEAQMNQLFQTSKFAQPSTRIVFEQEGIDLFAECRKA